MKFTENEWGSRWLFIIAAVGAAAGIGNLWRFPYLAYEYGGGAFFLAFIVSLLIIAIPLAIGEICLGQMSGAHSLGKAYASIKKPLKYLGWVTAFVSATILVYYVAVIAWGIRFIPAAFTHAYGNTLDQAREFFFSGVLQISESVGTIGGISTELVIPLIIVWTILFFSLFKGLKSLQRVVIWTATLPFLFLAILAIRALTLEGASEGLALFFTPEFSQLLNPKLWIAASTQAFFSVSIGFGIFIVYGSYNKVSQKITSSALWIVLGDFIVSLLAGIVVFGTLGYLAGVQGVASLTLSLQGQD